MQSDDDLRDRFRALAHDEAAGAPEFPRGDLDARLRAQRGRRAWYSPPRLAAIAASAAAAVLTLVVGLVLGTNTGYASARVESERERNALTATAASVTSQLVGLRVDVARTRSDLVRLTSRTAAPDRASLLAAEAELKEMEASITRIERDLTQSRASSAAQITSTRGIPMKRALALTCGALAFAAPTAAAAAAEQQGVPIVDLPAATVKTPETFGALLGVRQTAGGNLLVNDLGRRQIKLLDSALAVVGTPLDSTPGLPNSYGRRAPLIPYLGDSSLSADLNARTLLVLGSAGEVVRAIGAPTPQLPGAMMMGFSGIDDKGRILFRTTFQQGVRPGMPMGMIPGAYNDSAVVLRADLESRRVDTVGRVKVEGPLTRMRQDQGGPLRFAVDPMPVVDEWAVLSDGSIAFVRGHDYHIDWVHPDGTTHSTTKLPFDWKRLTDDDKQKLIDSARAEYGSQLATQRSGPPPGGDGPTRGARAGGGGGAPVDPGPPRPPVPVEYLPPALKDIADYYPSIRQGAARPDLDGNLWILPTSSAQSKNGELVYDVVNVKGDFRRVRVPLGRSIAGFGKGGVVYLQAGDKTNGFYLERTKLPVKK